MNDLDELAHELETEAEVLRALSHLRPKAAREFLLKLLLKINRQFDDSVGLTIAPTAVPEQTATEQKVSNVASVPKQRKGQLSSIVVEYVRGNGPLHKTELKAEMGRLLGKSKHNVDVLFYSMLKRKLLVRDENGNVTAA